MRYSAILNALTSNVWYIQPEKMGIICAYLQARIRGEHPQPEAKVATKAKNVKGKVAIMSLTGVMAQRMDAMEAQSGGTSTDAFGQTFQELADDKSIGAIVIDTDSPGGSAFGLEDLSERIRAARNQTRPIIAVANSLMASAAYYVASAADEIVAVPGAMVGSIGTIMVHADYSKALDEAGIKMTIFRKPEFKAEGNPCEELTQEAIDSLNDMTAQYYDLFLSAVSKNRGVPKSTVSEKYGKGRVMTANDALAAGMIDRIASFDSVVTRLQGDSGRVARAATIARHKYS
jgi:signal peptide peptidase SppA